MLGDAQSSPQAGTAEIEKMNEAGVSAVVGAFASAILFPFTASDRDYTASGVVVFA
jgi:branched-chain amino acid transport system substrate-binding protein